MKTVYSSKKIFKLYDEWKSFMDDSWDRGKDNLKFVEQSEQDFDPGAGKLEFEPMSFNFQWKLLKTAQANGKDIELSLNLNPVCAVGEEQETKTFKRLMKEIMLNGDNVQAFADSLDSVYSFGQAVLLVKNKREDEKTLNQIVVVENLSDPTVAFFDKRSPSPTFHDGEYCGFISKMTRKELLKSYPKIAIESRRSEEVRVADFWYKSRQVVNFIPLVSGEYKREDLINPARDMILGNTPARKGMVTKISYIRAVEGVVSFLEKKSNMDFNMLPMVINFGGMVWSGEKYQSYPLGYHLRDTQVLINYCGTVIADMMKASTADKWFFSPEQAIDPAAKNAINEINVRSGAIIVPDAEKIRREQPQQLPPTLVGIFNQLQTTIQSLAGSYFDSNSADIKASSGVALDKMFKRIDLVQNPVIAAHIRTLTIVGQILQSMIPIFYREQRTLCVQDSMGRSHPMIINQKEEQPGGQQIIKNNIADLKSRYDYQIGVSPSRKLQQQNLQLELAQLYTLYPAAIAPTIDLYAKALDVRDADVISRRLGVNIPPALVEYGNGTMDLQAYQKEVQQQTQEKQQEMLSSPQGQLINAKTQGELGRTQAAVMRAHSDAYNADTKRLSEQAHASTAHNQTIADAFKVALENTNTEQHQKLELIKTALAHANKLLEKLPSSEEAIK